MIMANEHSLLKYNAVFVGLCFLLFTVNAKEHTKNVHVQPENAARYDNYRMYLLHLETDEQVQIFVELEEISDSILFMGHARRPGQRLTIIVAAHKVADVTELLQRFSVEHQILVVFIAYFVKPCYKYIL